MAIKRKEIVDRMFERVFSLNIIDVLMAEGLISEVKRAGASFTAICPFHNDRKTGNFMINTDKNIAKCFSCGTAGHATTLIAHYRGLDTKDAVIYLAQKFNIITDEEYELITNSKITDKVAKQYVNYSKKLIREYKSKEYKAPIKVRDKVYRIFIKHMSLSENHKNHLLEERNISEERIARGKYFTFPSKERVEKGKHSPYSKANQKFLKEIKKKFGNLEILKGVPGFFQFSSPDSKPWNFMTIDGIGIPIFDENRKIMGIQIRKDVKDEHGGSRYIWFTSTFAITGRNEKMCSGTSSPSHIGVVYPDKLKNSDIYITEGNFKAEALAQKNNSIVITVQGVATWKSIPDVIEAIIKIANIKRKLKAENEKKEFKEFKVRNIFIVFDADMGYNVNVGKQALEMSKVLESKGNILFLQWNERYGKGIDDVYQDGNESKLLTMKKETFSKRYISFMEIVKMLENDEDYNIPSEKWKEYHSQLMYLTTEKLEKQYNKLINQKKKTK